jgi:alkyl hydroperoxide reductase subunit AhpF
MLDEFDRKRLRDGLTNLPAPIELILHPSSEETPFSRRLSEAADSYMHVAIGSIKIKKGDAAGLPSAPALTPSYRGHANIHYLAIPEGPEAPPFVEALVDLPKGAAGHDPEWIRPLSALKQPVQLWVFIASACPHCPQAVRAANRIALTTPQVTTVIIDAQQFPDLADRFKAKSVPLTVIDGEMSITGVIPPAKLVEKILTRDNAEIFLSLVETGRFDDALKKIHDGFTSAWKKSATQLRMGLMMVAEKALTQDPHSMNSLVPDLLPATKSADAALRGDTADLLGQIGHPSATEALKALLNDENPDVAEIAQDALDEIEKD